MVINTFKGTSIECKANYDRIISTAEIEMIDNIISIVGCNNHVFKRNFTPVYAKLYGNCNDDCDCSVVFIEGIQTIELRYCSPCGDWFISAFMKEDNGSIHRIVELQMTPLVGVSGIVLWLFSTLQLMDY